MQLPAAPCGWEFHRGPGLEAERSRRTTVAPLAEVDSGFVAVLLAGRSFTDQPTKAGSPGTDKVSDK